MPRSFCYINLSFALVRFSWNFPFNRGFVSFQFLVFFLFFWSGINQVFSPRWIYALQQWNSDVMCLCCVCARFRSACFYRPTLCELILSPFREFASCQLPLCLGLGAKAVAFDSLDRSEPFILEVNRIRNHKTQIEVPPTPCFWAKRARFTHVTIRIRLRLYDFDYTFTISIIITNRLRLRFLRFG